MKMKRGSTIVSQSSNIMANNSRNGVSIMSLAPSYGAILSPMTPSRKIGNAHLQRGNTFGGDNSIAFMVEPPRNPTNMQASFKGSSKQSTGAFQTAQPTDRVRYLHHQNQERVKAESEMIGRFDRSHGVNEVMAQPFKKPPLVMTAKPASRKVNHRQEVTDNNMWVEMIDRTWQKGDDVKKGEYSLSRQRLNEATQRTLDPSLQEAEKPVKVRMTRNFQNTFDVSRQDFHSNNTQLPPRAYFSKASETTRDPPMIIATKENTVLRDPQSMGGTPSVSRQIKQIRDFQSSITCIPRGSISPPKSARVSIGGGCQFDLNKENEVKGKRHLLKPEVTRFQATSQQFKEMGLGHQLGQGKEDRVKSAKRYYRGMVIIEPKTFNNQTYQNMPPKEDQVTYNKGTKKFWDRTQELHSTTYGQPDSERNIVPKELLKGRKPDTIKDVFRSQITSLA